MATPTTRQRNRELDLGSIIGSIVLLLLVSWLTTHVLWYNYNERQLNEAAIQSTDYHACKNFFNQRILPNYLAIATKQCRELTKWQVKKDRGYFTHQNLLYPQERYITPPARRERILQYITQKESWNEVQQSEWLP